MYIEIHVVLKHFQVNSAFYTSIRNMDSALKTLNLTFSYITDMMLSSKMSQNFFRKFYNLFIENSCLILKAPFE